MFRQVTTELRTLYGADNPNVVHYHAAFFDNGAITIAMEYCDAGSLADLLKARRQQCLQLTAAEKVAAAAAAGQPAQAPSLLGRSNLAGGGGGGLAVQGLPEPVIAHIARQIVAGLQYLHKELKVRGGQRGAAQWAVCVCGGGRVEAAEAGHDGCSAQGCRVVFWSGAGVGSGNQGKGRVEASHSLVLRGAGAAPS